MLVVATPQDLKAHKGKELVGDWLEITQKRINQFADATGDHQWIHVDTARAAKEMPGGKTIAHGFLTLSLLPMLGQQLWKVEKTSRGINYGSNKIRFTNTVPVGSRVRLMLTFRDFEDMEGDGVKITGQNVIAIAGQDRPALVAETISILYA